MLKKLFKYDIHFQIKRVLPLYLITLAMALALRCMQFLTQKLVFLQFILGFMVIGFIILLVALFLWTFIVSVKYFYDTMLKDEAYLRNTLPVSRSQIFFSQELVALCTLGLAVLVCLLSVGLAFFTIDGNFIISMIELLFGINGHMVGILLLETGIMLLWDYMAIVTLFFTAMMLGQTRQSNKVLYSIAFGVLLYICMQLGSMVGVLFNMTVTQGYTELVNNMVLEMDSLQYIILSAMISEIVISTIYIVGFHCLGVHIANTKLNLE